MKAIISYLFNSFITMSGTNSSYSDVKAKLAHIDSVNASTQPAAPVQAKPGYKRVKMPDGSEGSVKVSLTNSYLCGCTEPDTCSKERTAAIFGYKPYVDRTGKTFGGVKWKEIDGLGPIRALIHPVTIPDKAGNMVDRMVVCNRNRNQEEVAKAVADLGITDDVLTQLIEMNTDKPSDSIYHGKWSVNGASVEEAAEKRKHETQATTKHVAPATQQRPSEASADDGADDEGASAKFVKPSAVATPQLRTAAPPDHTVAYLATACFMATLGVLFTVFVFYL